MGHYVNPDNFTFSKAANSEIYVDKTGMLGYLNKVMDTEQCCVCVSRPRRFGKSIAARMVTAYYSKGCDSEKLFLNYKIAQNKDFKKHLNQYNVIHLDIAEMKVTMPKEYSLVTYIQKCVIDELRNSYLEIINKDAFSLPLTLADINEQTGERFIIVIDEWDTVFREDKYNQSIQDEYIDLLRGLFKGEKSQRFMKLAYLTGILPIKKYNSESALNNFDEFTMIQPEPLTEYVGFTEEEVKNLCQKYHMDFIEAQRWYDGYSFEGLQHMYSPNSVVKAMLRKKYNNYWTQTVAYESLKGYICMDFDGLKTSIIQMLSGQCCRVNISGFENDMTSFRKRDDVLTVLIHLGYLAYNADKKEVYIPNEEVRTAFADAIQETDWKPVIQAMQDSEALLHATWNKNSDIVAEGIEKSHTANASLLKYNDENSLSCVVWLAYYFAMNEYTIIRELPTGKGFADIVFLPRRHSDKPAMIVELKYDKTAEGAISQIKKRQYTKALEEYEGNMLLVGINYNKDDKNKKHSCVIEEWQK
ncbi:MAG: AAA family ATPase [bacterium]|nr:AAA family ATPase [bacterium]